MFTAPRLKPLVWAGPKLVRMGPAWISILVVKNPNLYPCELLQEFLNIHVFVGPAMHCSVIIQHHNIIL